MDPATTTVGDLLAALNTAFPGATVSLDANGNIEATNNVPGPSLLNVVIADHPANTGQTGYDLHKLISQAVGKDGDKVSQGIEVYDASGGAHSVALEFTKQTDGSWNINATMAAADGSVLDGQVDGINFPGQRHFRSGDWHRRR